MSECCPPLQVQCVLPRFAQTHTVEKFLCSTSKGTPRLRLSCLILLLGLHSKVSRLAGKLRRPPRKRTRQDGRKNFSCATTCQENSEEDEDSDTDSVVSESVSESSSSSEFSWQVVAHEKFFRPSCLVPFLRGLHSKVSPILILPQFPRQQSRKYDETVTLLTALTRICKYPPHLVLSWTDC